MIIAHPQQEHAFVGSTRILRVALYACLSVCCACSVYDTELISSKPNAVARARRADAGAVDADGGGSSATVIDAGRRGHEENPDDDGSVPMITTEITEHCGDGRITGNETCDVGIAAGMPGACPTECPELATCNQRELRNSGCQAECVLVPARCVGGDGCCPASCTNQDDSDCSSRCGDGVVQSEFGETCESESMTPCKTSDAQCDDRNPCTDDKLVGSAKNCNAVCTNETKTMPKDGDGCCVADADANSDNDCKPVCGNKIREPGEDCDGTDGCSARCRLTLQPSQVACLQMFGNDGDECAKCSCMNCAASYLACRAGAIATDNALCNDVLECARAKNCWGGACYCGDSLLCSVPDGLCMAEIEKAGGGATDFTTISLLSNDTTNPLGKSYAADTCRYDQCAAACR